MSRRRDRDRLTALLRNAWEAVRRDAEEADAGLDRWDLCDSIFDLLASEDASAAFQDEVRQRWLDRERDRRQTSRRAGRRASCTICGSGFTSVRSDARYCRPACRQKALRERRRQAG